MADKTRLSTRLLHSIRCTLIAVAGGGVALLPATLTAQDAGIMIMDDGAGPSVMHYGPIDTKRARTPDYERSDLPVFNKTLRLSDDQSAVVEQRLIEYIEAFNALVAEHLPPERQPQRIVMGGGEGDGGFMLEGLFGPAGGGPGAMGDIDMDALMEEGDAVAITVGAGIGMDPAMFEGGGTVDVDVMANPDGPDGEPDANVMIAIGGPDGEDIPEELREQLAKAAEEMAEKLREQMKKSLDEGGDPMGGALAMEDHMLQQQQRMEEMADRIAAIDARREGLRIAFVEDVRGQLADEQLERWPVLERALTRKKTLPRGRLSGERLDLIHLVDRMDLADDHTHAIQEPLTAYEMVLHDALVQRNAFLRDADDTVGEALKKGDTDRALSIIDQGTKYRIAVRDVNKWYTDELAQRLPEPLGRQFIDTVLAEAHPRVFRTTRGRKAFDAARVHADQLPTELIASIDELDVVYTDELRRINEEIIGLTRRHQPGESRRAIEMMQNASDGAGMVFHGTDDPIREGYARRRALDARYIKLLGDMLPPDVAAALPKPPKRRSGPMVIERSTFEPK